MNALSSNDLRAQPLGRDRFGNSYWSTLDSSCNLQIYQEHLDEETWQVVASTRDELAKLIQRLSGNERIMSSLEGLVDEDSSSNSVSLKSDSKGGGSDETKEKINEVVDSENSNLNSETIESVKVKEPLKVEKSKEKVNVQKEEDDDDESDEEEDDEDDDEEDEDEEDDEDDDDEEIPKSDNKQVKQLKTVNFLMPEYLFRQQHF